VWQYNTAMKFHSAERAHNFDIHWQLSAVFKSNTHHDHRLEYLNGLHTSGKVRILFLMVSRLENYVLLSQMQAFSVYKYVSWYN
jgi:hypothetical protein